MGALTSTGLDDDFPAVADQRLDGVGGKRDAGLTGPRLAHECNSHGFVLAVKERVKSN